MWIKTRTDFIYPEEPQLGKITESEVMLETGDIEYMAEVVLDHQEDNDGETPTYITMMDSISGEEIELLLSEYI